MLCEAQWRKDSRARRFGLKKKDSIIKFDPQVTAFAKGTRYPISSWDTESEQSHNPLIIRGIGATSQEALRHCWNTGKEYYAIDTGYFGNFKKKNWHRITKNNLQNLGPIVDRPGDRLIRQKWRWRRYTWGSHILICPPSSKAMSLWNQPDPETWTELVVAQIQKYTDRPIRVRLKAERIERVTNLPMNEALQDDIYCVVTYNSIAASEAVFVGLPCISLGPNSAQLVCNYALQDIESLHRPEYDEVEAYARHLSYCQFSQLEMNNGKAWRILNDY